MSIFSLLNEMEIQKSLPMSVVVVAGTASVTKWASYQDMYIKTLPSTCDACPDI
jgi:hypothetical protein